MGRSNRYGDEEKSAALVRHRAVGYPCRMNKYRSIDLLLQYLELAIADKQVAVNDRWLDDEQAIGFYKPGAPELAAYVSTHGQPPGWYDVELEFPELEDNRIAPTTDRPLAASSTFSGDDVRTMPSRYPEHPSAGVMT